MAIDEPYRRMRMRLLRRRDSNSNSGGGDEGMGMVGYSCKEIFITVSALGFGLAVRWNGYQDGGRDDNKASSRAGIEQHLGSTGMTGKGDNGGRWK